MNRKSGMVMALALLIALALAFHQAAVNRDVMEENRLLAEREREWVDEKLRLVDENDRLQRALFLSEMVRSFNVPPQEDSFVMNAY